MPEDFFNICIKRKVEIKKLDKLPKLDNNYLLFITKYQEVEIIPDISLFNYEEALNEFISEHDKKKKDLDKLIQDKQDQVKSLDKKIEKLEHIKSSKEPRRRYQNICGSCFYQLHFD